MNEELIAKAKEAKSAEELLAMAKESGVPITEELAKECFDRMHTTGELADDELDQVGGGCGGGGSVPSNAKVINDSLIESCDHYVHADGWLENRCCLCCRYREATGSGILVDATEYCTYGL